jgi:hypothetical protein
MRFKTRNRYNSNNLFEAEQGFSSINNKRNPLSQGNVKNKEKIKNRSLLQTERTKESPNPVIALYQKTKSDNRQEQNRQTGRPNTEQCQRTSSAKAKC